MAHCVIQDAELATTEWDRCVGACCPLGQINNKFTASADH